MEQQKSCRTSCSLHSVQTTVARLLSKVSGFIGGRYGRRSIVSVNCFNRCGHGLNSGDLVHLRSVIYYVRLSFLSGWAPPYLADGIHLVSEGPRRRLRSSTDRSCAVPPMHNTLSDRSFAAAGPCLWNSLPVHLCDEDISYNSFRSELKTFWLCCFRGTMRHPD